MRQSGSQFVTTIASFFADIGPEGQWRYTTAILVTFCCLVGLSIYSLFNNSTSSRLHRWSWLNSDFLFAFLLFSFVMLCRIPTAIYGFQNPDEGVWIACAKSFFDDPRPWVSFDTSTSGPLVLFPLLLLKMAKLPVDFGSIKMAAGLTMGLTTLFSFLTYCNVFGKSIARLAILPAAVALSFTTYWDFVSYNGEHVPLLLLSISVFLISRSFSKNHIAVKDFAVAGFLLGLLPFAKLQSTPLGLFVALMAFALMIQKKAQFKHMIYFALSGILAPLCLMAWVVLGGGLMNFWNSYITYNLFYAQSQAPADVSLFQKVTFAWRLIYHTADFTGYFVASTAICLFCLLTLDWRHLRTSHTRQILFFAVGYFLTSLFCIGQPYREYTHYSYFAFFSINLLFAAFLSCVFLNPDSTLRLLSTKKMLYAAVVFISTMHFQQKFSFHPHYFVYLDVYQRHYVHMPQVIDIINRHSKPNDKMAIWGRSSTFYGEVDLIMGTRYTDTAAIIDDNPFRPYMTDAFLADLERTQPKIFLDAISPSAMTYYYRSEYGFEKFPTIKQYVDKHYQKVGEFDDIRVYERR